MVEKLFSTPQTIDAVITWVDGADPQHKIKLDAYLMSLGKPRPRSAHPSRFHNSGEIDYCVSSLLQFAPWLRRIYIVTDNQRPAFLTTLKGTIYEDKVIIVDHKTIFRDFEDSLPTFNSSTILTALWRIPNLAEHFIFLNDDFSLIRPVLPQDFFRNDKVVLRGSWETFVCNNFFKKLANKLKLKKNSRNNAGEKRVSYKMGQENSAKILGFSEKYFTLPHNPHAWRVSSFTEFFTQYPEIFKQNIQYKLRDHSQFIGESFSAHIEITNKRYIVDNHYKTLQLKPNDQSFFKLWLKLQYANINNRYAFLCIQNFEGGSARKRKLIQKWLDNHIGSVDELVKTKARSYLSAKLA